MTRAFIGLGSNLGDRLENLRGARRALEKEGTKVVAVSSVYESKAIGPPQPDYLNAVCEIETDLGARELLEVLKSTEVSLGRQPGERWGPRVIDLDLLLYGQETINEDGLKVPHPEMDKRSFVLVPLAEIDDSLTTPSKVFSALDFEEDSIRLFAGPDWG